MQVEIQLTCEGVDWQAVAHLLKTVGMGHHDPDLHRRAFEASHTTVFAFRGKRLIGMGRAICDGAYQAAVYDCAVLPEYQRQGIGSKIMGEILAGTSPCNLILYAAPGKQGFYETLGFRKLKTGMALFSDAAGKRAHGYTD